MGDLGGNTPHDFKTPDKITQNLTITPPEKLIIINNCKYIKITPV